MNWQKQPYFITLLIYIPVLAALIFPVTTSAQANTTDVITLKTGSIIKGHIPDITDSSKVRIETLCQNIWVFDITEVASVEFNVPQPGGWGAEEKYPYRTSGYVNITEPGLLFGSGNNEKNTIFSVLMTNGYRFRNNYMAGLGLGLEFFEQTQLPVFIDTRYVLTDRSIAPVIILRGGYSFMLEDPQDTDWYSYKGIGGWLWAAGLGVQLRLNPHNMLSISMLYRYQDNTIAHTDTWYQDETRVTKKYNRLAFRIGIVFD